MERVSLFMPTSATFDPPRGGRGDVRDMGKARSDGEAVDYKAKYKKEGERLTKLWEAYHLQEKELWEAQQRAGRLQKALMEKDLAAGDLRDDLSSRDTERKRLQLEVSDMQERIALLEGTITEQGQVIHRLRAVLAEHGVPEP